MLLKIGKPNVVLRFDQHGMPKALRTIVDSDNNSTNLLVHPSDKKHAATFVSQPIGSLKVFWRVVCATQKP